MRRFHLFLLSALLLVPLVGSLALAKDRAPVTRAEILTDQKKGAVSIVIDGKTVMVIDAAGLHVDGDVRYGGTLTDVGHGHVWDDQ